MNRYTVGITGGSASGKTRVCTTLKNNMNIMNYDVTVLSQDNFYKGLPENIDPSNYDFDHPDSIDFQEMSVCLRKLKNGEETEVPFYDFKTHKRSGTSIIKPAKIILVEGILIFTSNEILELLDLKLFIEASAEARVFRRIIRDEAERGRKAGEIQKQYMQFVKPSFDNHIMPTMRFADMIIINEQTCEGSEQIIGIKVLIDHILSELTRR